MYMKEWFSVFISFVMEYSYFVYFGQVVVEADEEAKKNFDC